MKLPTNLLILFVACSVTARAVAQTGTGTDSDWAMLMGSMDKMRTAMGGTEKSGNDDVDFVKLMLPHHQAAVDMAKVQLLYGKDPQMRELAQKIITDQREEIGLMQSWLQKQQPAKVELNPTRTADAAKGN
jgi:uncharacterized protein (DUF305 family)